MKEYFEGYYYKHQKGDNTLCIIVGRSNCEEFMQIITNELSFTVPFIGENKFSKNGIEVNIKTDEFSLIGSAEYENLTAINYDIMGPFKYFPMECKHEIVSMHHKIVGGFTLNGIFIDFTGGIGYIEKDSGVSFPKTYEWIQWNNFSNECAIIASIADIPFYGINFAGCICVIHYQGIEYRLATYLGARIKSVSKNGMLIKQGKYTLEIKVNASNGHRLIAPKAGEMSRIVIENPVCHANFKFFIENDKIFDYSTKNASFECEL